MPKLPLLIFLKNNKVSLMLQVIKNILTSPFKTWLMVQVIKEDMERTLKNTNMKPLSHSSYLRLQVLSECFWDVEEKLCLLNNLSFADLAVFIPDLLAQVWFKFPFPPFHFFFYWLDCLWIRKLDAICVFKSSCELLSSWIHGVFLAFLSALFLGELHYTLCLYLLCYA